MAKEGMEETNQCKLLVLEWELCQTCGTGWGSSRCRIGTNLKCWGGFQWIWHFQNIMEWFQKRCLFLGKKISTQSVWKMPETGGVLKCWKEPRLSSQTIWMKGGLFLYQPWSVDEQNRWMGTFLWFAMEYLLKHISPHSWKIHIVATHFPEFKKLFPIVVWFFFFLFGWDFLGVFFLMKWYKTTNREQ